MEAKFDDALPSMMETVVLVPAQLQVCPGPGLEAATSLAPGLSLSPHTGHLQQLILPPFPLLGSLDPKHRFGLHDEIKQVSSQQSQGQYVMYCDVQGAEGGLVRHCNWVRFLRTSLVPGPEVNMVAR